MIERFDCHELQAIFEGNRLPGPNDADVVCRVEKSGKLLVYVVLRFIESLGVIYVDNLQDRLATILGSRKGPDDKPYSAVDTLYLQVLRKAISQESPS